MKKIFISCVVVFLVTLFLWAISFTSFENWLHPAHPGSPAVFQKDIEYWSRVSAPIVTNKRLYLLYDSLSIVKVYDLNGSYLYSIHFSNIRHRGVSHLYAKEDELFFQNSGQSGLYYFKSDQFVDFFPDDEVENTLLPFSANKPEYRSEQDSAGNSYRIEGANIIKEDRNGDKSIFIHRASWLYLYQNNSFLIIMITAFFSMVFIIKKEL